MSNFGILVTAVNVGGIWSIVRNANKETTNGEAAMDSAFATLVCIGLLVVADLSLAGYYLLKG